MIATHDSVSARRPSSQVTAAVRHILRLTGLFLVMLVMISGAALYCLAAGSSTYLDTIVMAIIVVQPYMAC